MVALQLLQLFLFLPIKVYKIYSYFNEKGDDRKNRRKLKMTIREKIFWVTIIVALVGTKAVEMLQSFDFNINPIETSIKIIVMVVLATELIKTRLLPKAKAC